MENQEIKPHVCPVCCGNGIVPNGFYRQTLGQWSTSDITPEQCRTCSGTGIVWQPKFLIELTKG